MASSSTKAGCLKKPRRLPLAASVQFDGPPGPLQMRIVVEGQRGQVIDSVSRDLTLPDFTRVQVSLATPRVFRGRTVRDLTAIKANPTAVPTADRDFSRTDRLLIRTEAYTPGGAVPALTARLLNRGGGKMAVLPVQAGQGGAGDIELPLSSFAAGDYLIELNAKTDTGTAQELIAFKVGRTLSRARGSRARGSKPVLLRGSISLGAAPARYWTSPYCPYSRDQRTREPAADLPAPESRHAFDAPVGRQREHVRTATPFLAFDTPGDPVGQHHPLALPDRPLPGDSHAGHEPVDGGEVLHQIRKAVDGAELIAHRDGGGGHALGRPRRAPRVRLGPGSEPPIDDRVRCRLNASLATAFAKSES